MKLKSYNTDDLTLKQQEALQWFFDNRKFLNVRLIEDASGAYRNCIQKHIAGSQTMSQNAAIKIADFIISFRQ